MQETPMTTEETTTEETPSVASQMRNLKFVPTAKHLIDAGKYRRNYFKGMSPMEKSALEYWVTTEHFLPNVQMKVKGIEAPKEFWKNFFSDSDLAQMLHEIDLKKFEEYEAKEMEKKAKAEVKTENDAEPSENNKVSDGILTEYIKQQHAEGQSNDAKTLSSMQRDLDKFRDIKK